MLVPYKDAIDVTLLNALPPHTRHDLMFKLTVDLVKIDAPMYPLSKLEDKALGAWLDNMLAKGWIVKKAFLVSSLVVFANKSNRSLCPCVNYTLLNNVRFRFVTLSRWRRQLPSPLPSPVCSPIWTWLILLTRFALQKAMSG
ncbi:hypothetical protein DSO57_1002929 [Entomophthora muscae]|uniref:Uncharacterized protein n=1 Tax=Entomophthora muscae TaxID=34485 RepID=A0ACC2T876_9FUNG|nr:hypothetical protein DSO57_1002929 [Entomophthora muscae]